MTFYCILHQNISLKWVLWNVWYLKYLSTSWTHWRRTLGLCDPLNSNVFDTADLLMRILSIKDLSMFARAHPATALRTGHFHYDMTDSIINTVPQQVCTVDSSWNCIYDVILSSSITCSLKIRRRLYMWHYLESFSLKTFHEGWKS